MSAGRGLLHVVDIALHEPGSVSCLRKLHIAGAVQPPSLLARVDSIAMTFMLNRDSSAGGIHSRGGRAAPGLWAERARGDATPGGMMRGS